MAPAHFMVTEDLPPESSDMDYEKLSDLNDLVVIMLYDQNIAAPGPIAGQSWVEQRADNLFQKMDSSKVILGIANYCYDWAVACDKYGNLKPLSAAKSEPLGVTLTRAKEADADIEMDDLNPQFYYSDSNNVDHVVYVLDAVTVYNQIMALKGYEPKGVALWRLGSEDPTIWSFFDDDTLGRPLGNIKQLSNVDLKYQIDTDSSQGELMQVSQTGASGRRDLKLDKDGLIISEAYKPYPTPYVVGGVGFCPGKLALTFDDGPDPVYTRKILDILKEKKVPGTFFVIGEHADANPDLVRREWAEGNDIGNHTFTHPNLAEKSPIRVSLELNATQRLIESLTGHSTRLFRPPYGNSPDGHAASDERQAQLMRITQQLGYITVDMFSIRPTTRRAARRKSWTR